MARKDLAMGRVQTLSPAQGMDKVPICGCQVLDRDSKTKWVASHATRLIRSNGS
jgi:hypothetical protein